MVAGAVGASTTFSPKLALGVVGGQVDVTGLRSTLRDGAALGAVAFALCLGALSAASAETLDSALARAYRGNPTLGAQRASVRATDENVPRALSLGRPRVRATADIS